MKSRSEIGHRCGRICFHNPSLRLTPHLGRHVVRLSLGLHNLTNGGICHSDTSGRSSAYIALEKSSAERYSLLERTFLASQLLKLAADKGEPDEMNS